MEAVEVVRTKSANLKPVSIEKKTVLLCTNGFQTTDTHDFSQVYGYYMQNFSKDNPLCEVRMVPLFEASDKKTHHSHLYEKRLRKAIEEAISQGYEINLMGYSFSCALVSKMAYVYRKHVNSVILVAPIYDTILNNMIPGYLKYAKRFNDLKKKYGAKISNSMNRQTVQGMFFLMFSILRSILKNRKYMRHLDKRTLIIRGTDDVMCTSHSIKKIVNRLKGEYAFCLYSGMNHSILKSARLNGSVFDEILNFSFNTPFLVKRNETVKTQARKVIRDEDGEEIPTFTDIIRDLDPDSLSDDLERKEQL